MIGVWEVHLGRIVEGVRVVAPDDASLDEIADAARLSLLAAAKPRPEFAASDEEHYAQLEVSSVKRCIEKYAAHPRLVVVEASRDTGRGS